MSEDTQDDLINRIHWIAQMIDGAKHATTDREARRHLGRALSHVELAVERLKDIEKSESKDKAPA